LRTWITEKAETERKTEASRATISTSKVVKPFLPMKIIPSSLLLNLLFQEFYVKGATAFFRKIAVKIPFQVLEGFIR
jgi:hypothetical protein